MDSGPKTKKAGAGFFIPYARPVFILLESITFLLDKGNISFRFRQGSAQAVFSLLPFILLRQRSKNKSEKAYIISKVF
jgi:hypothetical protein